MLMLNVEAVKRQHVTADPCLRWAKSTVPGRGGRGSKYLRWLPLQRLSQAPAPAHLWAGQTPGACTRRSTMLLACQESRQGRRVRCARGSGLPGRKRREDNRQAVQLCSVSLVV